MWLMDLDCRSLRMSSSRWAFSASEFASAAGSPDFMMTFRLVFFFLAYLCFSSS
jgi:hypothetical protein